ncbi:MAG: Sensor histidine kinase RcsC [Chroococcidiopsis sp. SAG 2025]|uniref:PAS domain-containing protein n=1 Tax=Chroococcidiopsis sp. SAG 2025 TaxID=171389 RepID=UPI0029373CCD|nr:PAS domain-containing protein [Chroococcidiopsis sp. SAG 2025]MDV2994111.1 Sensor histidine kinase RcsC [Chroococcidiopsis sp. SAG 2025]
MPKVTRSQIASYGVAILVVMLALALMLGLDSWLGMTKTPFLLFYGAVAIAAWYGGLKPGIVATILSILFSNYFFHYPTYTFIVDLPDLLRLGLFALQGVMVSYLCEELRIAKHRAEIDRQREQKAKAQAEVMQQRLAFLDRANTVLTSSLDYETTLRSVVELTIPEFADLCTVDILPADLAINPLVAVQAKDPDRADLVRQLTAAYPLDLNDQAHPITRVFQTGRSELIPEVTEANYVAMAQDAEQLEFFRQLKIKSAICVPLLAHEEVFGVLSLMLTTSQRHYCNEDLTLAEELGRRVGLAMENSRLHRQLKQAMQRQEATLALIDTWLASSPVGLAFLDTNLRYVHVNQALANINGIPLNDHFNRSVREVLPKWGDMLEPFLRQVLQTGEPLLNQELSGETNLPGVYRHSLVNFYPVCLASGQTLGIGATVVDITQLKQTQTSLSQREAELSLITNTVPALIAYVDTNQRYRFVNRTYEQWFGHPATEICGRHIRQVLGEAAYEKIRPYVEQALAGQAVRYESQVPYQDGGVRYIEAVYIPQFDSRGRVEGFVSLVSDISDRKRAELERDRLLQQEQAARQLAELNIQRIYQLQNLTAALAQALTTEQVREILLHQGLAAFNATRGWIGVLHEDGKTVEIVCSIGYQEEEIASYRHVPLNSSLPLTDTIRTGEMVIARSPAEYQQLYPSLADTYIASGSQAIASLPLTIEGRTIGSLGLSFNQSRDFDLAERAFMITLARQCAQALERSRLYDAEKVAKEAAESANRIKDEFLAVLSHELRSPLNPILGWAKLLRSRQYSEAARNRALETIERNAKLQAQLVDDLLDVSRILRGKLALKFVPVDLISTIRAAMETVQLSAEAKQIHLVFEGAGSSEQGAGKRAEGEKRIQNPKSKIQNFPTPTLPLPIPLVLGDSGRLQQVVWNLLSNAVKFTPAGGRVEISLQLPNPDSHSPTPDSQKSVQIQVSDTGKGISPDFLPYVFDYFRQADSSTTRTFGGLGLGLAIVRHLVELHGGTVGVDSLGEGRGTTFTMTLPLLEGSRESGVGNREMHHSPSQTQQLLLQGVRVLAVDDDPDMREYVNCVLQQHGAKATVVSSAEDALMALSQQMPDIILSDIGMPLIDGYMLLEKVRSLVQSRSLSIPAIALSAYAGEYDQQKALAAGFQLHLPKPVDPDELVKAIAEIVSTTRSCDRS